MIALVDGDILTYRVGFGCEDTSERIAIAKLAEYLEDLVFIHANCEKAQGYLTGRSNYRDDIAKTQTYKGHRLGVAKPKHFDLMREYMEKAWGFEMQEGQEADDAIGIEAYKLDPRDYVICSIDKDLNNLRGWHYNFHKNEMYYVKEEEAIKNFYKQLLTGDRTDNIPGIKGIGDKKADKILDGLEEEEDLYRAVLEVYKYNRDYLLEQGRLLWIRRKKEELWMLPE